MANNNQSNNTFIKPKLKVKKPVEKQKVEADKIVKEVVAKNEKTSHSNTSFFSATPTPAIPLGTKKEENAPTKLSVSTQPNVTIADAVKKPNKIPKISSKLKRNGKTDIFKSDGKSKEGNKEKGEEDTKAAITHTTPRNPKEDPNFKKLEGRVETTAKAQQAHEPADASAASAQSAAVSPANERQSIAQSNQVDTMDAAEPGTFDAKTFKTKLMKRIEGMQLPKNQDEAANFEDNNNIDQVNSSVTQDVSAEKTAATGPVEQTAQQKPNVATVPERKVKPLPKAPIGSKPKTVNPTKAMPPKRGNAEVNKPLEDNMSEVDQQMSKNKVTDAQLAKSNEPQFTEGLDAKGKAEENTKNAPAQLRKQEQGVLKSTQANAKGKEQSKLSDMHAGRAKLLNTVAGSQKQTGGKDTSERAKIASAINKIYERSKADVEKILNDLDTKVKVLFTAGTILAKSAFENHVDVKMTAYKAKRYSGVIGAGRWLKDKFAGMPDEVNAYFVSGRQVYVDTMDKVITIVAKLVANKLTEAKTRVTTGKKEVQEYVQSLPKNLQKLGKEAAEDINDKFDELEDSVNSKQDALIDSLAEQYMEGLNAVDARIEEMKAANRGLIDKALGFINGIIETIKKLKDLITSLLAEIQNAMDVIMEDPIGFVSTLFEGVGKGIDMFMANIKKHLLGGFVTWLTGAMGPVGITIPDNLFSLKGIFNLVMQILGLGWDFMRKKAVLLIGEPMVATMEKGFEMFQIIRTKGVSGMWEYVKEQFTDLKETIIESIKSMLITQVIEAGIKWLLSLLIPGAGFIKAIMAIKDLIVFFVESAIMLIPSLINAIKSLASGNVAGVSKAIEKGLAMLLPLVIGLFAKLIGLGGLVKKVQKIIKKVRKRIDRAVTKMIKKAKKKFKSLMKKGKAKVKGAAKKILQWWKKKKKFKTKDGKNHTIFFKGKGKSAKIYMASDIRPMGEHYKIIKAAYNANPTKYGAAVGAEIPKLKKAIDELEDLKSRSDKKKKSGKTLKYATYNDGLGKNIANKMAEIATIIGKLPGSLMDDSNEEKKLIRPKSRPFIFPVQNTTRSKTGTKLLSDSIDGKVAKAPVLSFDIANTGSRAVGSTSLYGALDNAWGITVVPGHLLNHQIGGSGTNTKNLAPITKSANNKMAANQEKDLKKKVLDQNKVVSYTVIVFWPSGEVESNGFSYIERMMPLKIESVIEELTFNETAHKNLAPDAYDKAKKEAMKWSFKSGNFRKKYTVTLERLKKKPKKNENKKRQIIKALEGKSLTNKQIAEAVGLENKQVPKYIQRINKGLPEGSEYISRDDSSYPGKYSLTDQGETLL